MEEYEAIIKQIEEELDKIEYNINNKLKDKSLIQEDLFNVTNKTINTRDSFKIKYFKYQNSPILEEREKKYAYILLDKLSDCIARCAYLRGIIYI